MTGKVDLPMDLDTMAPKKKTTDEESPEKFVETNIENQKKRKEAFESISVEQFIKNKMGSFSQDYRMGKVLGEGAYGKVCLVTQKKTDMIRAMKMIKKSSLKNEAKKELITEVNILRGLDHPNIVKLLEIYEDEKYYYLVQEYCSGGELFDKIQECHSFTEKQAAEYLRQIVSAVYYCHEKGIVHRDLKPENLLIESRKPQAELKVIDFGVSANITKGAKLHEKFGTPYYIAPEVLNRNYDEKCDIWSCGVILFILLCGYPPFNGPTDSDIMKAVKSGKFTFDEPDWKHISLEAKQLITKMLTYSPSKRPSAKEVLDDAWLRGHAQNVPFNANIIKNMAAFNAQSKLRQAILTFISSQVSAEKDRDELLAMFKTLDKDGNGRLTINELKAGYTKVFHHSSNDDAEVERIFKMIDTNNSGEIDFSEFIVAAATEYKSVSKKRIEQTFKLFDLDGDGFIDKKELLAVFGLLEIHEDEWTQLIKGVDKDNDGRISIQEFAELLSNNFN